MEILAKFYSHYWSSTPIQQTLITSKTHITKELENFGVAGFIVPIFEGLQEDCKVELYESTSNTDTLIFEGYIYEIEPIWGQFALANITARNGKALFKKRLALQKYSFSNKTIKGLIQELITTYNENYNENWEVVVKNIEDKITLDVALGDDYYGIFDELAEETNSRWKVEGGKIFFQKEGEDLTNDQIIEFNGKSPNPGNISTIEVVGTATRGNIVLVEDLNNNTHISTAQFEKTGILTGVIQKQIRVGDTITKTENIAEQKARLQRQYSIEIINNSIQAEIGDKITAYIVNTNSFYDYSGAVFVVKKEILYENATKIVKYGIGEFTCSPFFMKNWLQGVEKSIKMLRLKS